MPQEPTREELESRLQRLNQRMEHPDLGSEEKFRICLETLLDGFAIFTSVRSPSGEIEDFRFDFINEAGCRLNQRSREETLGRRLLELFPAHRDQLFAAYRRVVDTGEPMSRETLFYEDVFGSGQRLNRAFDLRAVKLGDGLAITWRDTTERCRTEKTLREQEFRFRAIFENSSEAILLTAPDGRVLAANPAACRIAGRSEAEICAAGREGMVDTTEPRARAFMETRTREGHAHGELTMKRGDGSRYPVELSSTLFINPAGDPLTVILFRDLSEQKRLEARSRNLAALVESTEDAIYASDMDGTITDWNDGATALYGYTAEEAIGKPPSLIVPEDLLPDTQNLLGLLRAGQRLRNHETLRRRKDGSLIHVSLTASPIVHGDATISGISVIARDITDRVRVEAERDRIIQELQAALADVRTLSGLVPICSWCKRIRNDQGYWTQLEQYIQAHSQAQFTHGICPSCVAEFNLEPPDQGSGPSGA
ncbi:MAG: PAS domain-containing protein [Geothrix sp.]|nr:PAS domain-containing protein [Geothrix sp.]